MRLVFSERAWEDRLHWQAQDPALVGRINDLLKQGMRTPFTGTGKPEPLRGSLSGWWSRRITLEHRLVYRIEDASLLVAQCRYHS